MPQPRRRAIGGKRSCLSFADIYEPVSRLERISMNKLTHLPSILVILFCCSGVHGEPLEPAGDANRSHYIREAGADRVIVFVHGIFENAIDTWTDAADKRAPYFPQLVADDPDLKEYDIYVVEYPSLRLSTRKFTIDDAVAHIKERLDHDHLFASHNEVIFVCHSMGGIVVERFMLKYRDAAQKVVLMLLYAVPQEGSSLANIAKLFLGGNKQLEALLSTDVNIYLDNLDAEWRAAGFSAAMTCIYETKPTMGFIVVDRRGATRLCREDAAPINGNHSEVVKPASRQDEPYVIFRNALEHQLHGHWVIKPIMVEAANGERVAFTGIFRDIYLLDHKRFLGGVHYEGGGSGDVGSGFLLYTSDESTIWRDITSNVVSGKGDFKWGQRPYSWNEVGPVNSLAFYKRYRNGSYQPEGWLASATGVYVMDKDDKCTMAKIAECTWHRSTPSPDQPGQYALFFRLANIEAFSEIYAVGWQGISHWSSKAGGSGKWEIQMPTYYYEVDGIAEEGGYDNREVWAVGRSGKDESGKWGADSHGAVYHLGWPANRWESLPLLGISFVPGQALLDILIIDRDTVLAVGQGGLIIRGRRHGTPVWTWETLSAQTSRNLTSIAVGGHALWVVGDGGLILRSTDQGTTWARVAVKDLREQALTRVRFFGDDGWILGANVVLQYISRRQ